MKDKELADTIDLVAECLELAGARGTRLAGLLREGSRAFSTAAWEVQHAHEALDKAMVPRRDEYDGVLSLVGRLECYVLAAQPERK